MAAATVASSRRTVFGDRHIVEAKLTTPADTNTYDTGLYNIDSAFITGVGTSSSVAQVTIASISAGTITLSVTGTAIDCFVLAIGD